MGYVRIAPLALFLLATSIMFSMKNIEAGECPKACSPNTRQPCGSSGCYCMPTLEGGVCLRGILPPVAKMIDEHPNLCKSHDECIKKGSGNFCAPYPNHYMDYGWCFTSDAEELKSFLVMPREISK
ncbi:hypothetical protein ACSQ67_024215 [Phaseolus vulgaris]